MTSTHNLQKTSADFARLEAMYEDHLAHDEIYQASQFWDKLNRLNIEWLRDDGLDNFKRTVNNNYFNWMVTTRSAYFRTVVGRYLRSLRRFPRRLWRILTANIGEMWHRTYISHTNKGTALQRRLYALYVVALDQFVRDHDEYGLYGALNEPKLGNPLSVHLGKRMVSQDLANSYLEYCFIRKSLGEAFNQTYVIAEIGAGYGRLAYMLHLLKHGVARKLILVDLPPALMVSQWYLRNMFPSANRMEYRNFTHFDEIRKEFDRAEICFLLPHQLQLLPDKSLDLLINVSSLQEMSREQINHYYDLIDHKARFFYTKQWFFWENSEDKMQVPAIIYPTKPHWELRNARVNPVHNEFFEALFKV